MTILIEKSRRCLHLYSDNGEELFACPVALGRQPVGAKAAEGDGRTPEGSYYPCVFKPEGRWGRSIGLSYPSPADGEKALAEGRIDAETLAAIASAWDEHRRPPWGSPLGGEIYLHEGGTASDWTAGCIAVSSGDMNRIYPHARSITKIEIRE